MSRSLVLRKGLRWGTALAVLWLALLGGVASEGASPHRGVPREQCFPTELLPPPLRLKSEELLLKALDNEALYSFIGGLKPMSTFIEFRIPLDDLDLAPLEETRRALTVWKCGEDLYADVHHFAEPHQGRLYAEAAVWNRRLLSDLILRHHPFFTRFGITPSAHPMEVVMAIEYHRGVDRLKGYGYLYGYPDYAVEFFAAAEAEKMRSHRSVERDIVSIPTYARPAGAFAWAVPVGHRENGADRDIRERAGAILEEYRARRKAYIGPGRPGVVALLRDWFDDGEGRCSPRNAKVMSYARR
ncbi:MAG: hypothetical protein ACE5JI_08365 [Acidobacteriota bacterium]